MKPPADEALLAALAALASALRVIDAPSMIIGGIAVIARGVPRQTVDVDATLWAEAIELDRLLAVLAEHGIVGRIPDVKQFAEERQVLLLQHQPTATPMEVSLAWLPFEREALGNATRVDFGGVQIPVAIPEDLIIYKAIAWRDRDRADIERLLRLHRKDINLTRVRSLVSEFFEALEAPERRQEFEALIARVSSKESR